MDRREELLHLLADVEKQMNDTTLSHSDQQLLDQAWEAYTEELDFLDELQQQVDDRRGCEQCAGCVYCLRDASYDGNDEV
jgi:hypothetical protein